jgi:GT2 family glycosyltransferase
LVSIVILNYNGKKFLSKCLDSVSKTNYPNFEVILVDNASTDGSAESEVKSLNLSNLKVIHNTRNLGFAEGNNIGARSANGDYVVFLNNDTVVDPEWLKELVSVMESDRNIGAAQSKLIQFDRKTIDSTGDFINFYGRGWLRGYGEEDKGQYDQKTEIFSARGAGMIVRKQILNKIDYFDSTFFMVCEDIDLCWRIRLNGYTVAFVPKSIIYHFGSGTRKMFEKTAESYYYNVRNCHIMLIKNHDLTNLYLSVATSVLTELTLFLISLPFPSKKTYNLSRLRALLWNLFNFRSVWIKRLRVQYFVRKVSGSQVKKLMIKGNSPFIGIVWNLFHKDEDYTQFLNESVRVKNRWVS